jgi:transcription elongation factor S-II
VTAPPHPNPNAAPGNTAKKSNRKKVAEKITSIMDTIETNRPNFRLLYQQKTLQLLYNLRLNHKYLLAKYTPQELVLLDDTELAMGTEYENIMEENVRKMQHLKQILENAEKSTVSLVDTSNLPSLIVCRACHSGEVVVIEKQTRSGDEGMTLFCTCKKCGNKWKK